MTQHTSQLKRKLPRPPPGPPNWVEGPQLPTKEQREQLEKELREKEQKNRGKGLAYG